MAKIISNYDELPLLNRKVYDLVIHHAGGNVKQFAESIGVKQQVLDRIFKVDARNGKYPSVSGNIREALCSKFGLDEAWFYNTASLDKHDGDKALPIFIAYEYLRSKGIVHTQKDVCTTMGVSKENISRAFNGNEKYLTPSFLQRFNSSFGFIFNEEFLMNGTEPMLKDANVVPAPNHDGELYTENTHGAKFYAVGDDFRMEVRLVPFCAYGRFINELNTLGQDNDDWGVESFMTDKIVHGNYLAFEIKGDSMDDGTRNSFEEGDIVLTRELDRVHWKDGLRFNDHPYWVVVFDNSVLIKQIISQDLINGTITFHSINPSPEYSDFTLNMDDIRTLYYVLQKKPKVIKF